MSDNELNDACGIAVLNMIKFQSEKRDNNIWSDGLRGESASMSDLNKSGTINEGISIFNVKLSSKGVLQKNLSSQNLKSQQKQREKLNNIKGFRVLNLRQNQLKDMFGQCLENVFCFDKYMKTINVSHNRMSHECIKNLVGPKLRENTSILSLDVRFNQGTTS